MKKVTSTKKNSRIAAVDLEPALIAAAKKLLHEGGPGALSVRAIAAEAGVAPMGVYNRFANKNGVVDALFIDGFVLFNGALRGAKFPIGTEKNVVKAYLEATDRMGIAYRCFATENPSLYELMFMKSVADYVPSEVAMLSARAALTTLIERVEWGQRAKILLAGDSEEISQRVWAACHGAAALEIAGIGPVVDRERHFRKVVATLYRGLLRAP